MTPRYFYFVAYLSSYHEKTDQCTITSSPRSYRPPVYHSRKLVGLFSTLSLMLSVMQGSCEYQHFYSRWFDPTHSQTQVYNSRGRRFYHSTIGGVKHFAFFSLTRFYRLPSALVSKLRSLKKILTSASNSHCSTVISIVYC